jgi:hypothetical protein
MPNPGFTFNLCPIAYALFAEKIGSVHQPDQADRIQICFRQVWSGRLGSHAALASRKLPGRNCTNPRLLNNGSLSIGIWLADPPVYAIRIADLTKAFASVDAMRQALEAGGIEFIAAGQNSPSGYGGARYP